MLLSSITPSDEFAFMRRRGAPKNRELGTSSASLGYPAPVRRSRQLPRRSSRWRKAIAARIDALLPSTDHAATWQQGGGLGSLAEFMLRCVRPEIAGHDGTVDQIHLVARGRSDCSGARRLERLGVRGRTEAR